MEKKGKTSASQIKASMKWTRSHCKTMNFRLNVTTDSDIIGWLDGKSNKQGYIKSLIRKDMR